MSAHARLGPSNHRWPHCPGSVREEANYEDIAGAAAIDGTGSHLLLEMCLENNVRAEAYDQQIIGANHEDQPNGWLVALDRIERVQMCLDYIQRRVSEMKLEFTGCEVVVEAESKSDPGAWMGREDWWGTCDVTITAYDPVTYEFFFIETVDYKDGRGWVHADNNTQLQSYLGGKVAKMKKGFRGHGRMTIVQPKTNPPVRYQDNVSAKDINAFMCDLGEAARATDDLDAPCIPDDKGGKGHCQWCKHKKNCTALTQSNINEVKIMTNEMSLFQPLEEVGDITQLDAVKLADIADAKARADAVFKQVDDEIERRLNAGLTVPGYAMQPGNSKKVWSKSEEEIAKALKGRRLKKDDIYPSKLISPTQMLKLSQLTEEQKSKLKRDLISVVAGNLTLKKVARTEQKEVAMFDDLVSQSAPVVEQPVTDAPEAPVSFF